MTRTSDIRTSVRRYEKWLGAQLRGEIVAADLRRKHEKMRESPFSFLRGTYWRWAETVLETCPDLAGAPGVLAVGDIHLENFGTWRDVEGRLIWGVNDFDEAAHMPYALDLVRLATSAILAQPRGGAVADAIARNLLAGYRAGLEAPTPIVLDRKSRRLRRLVEVSEEQRKDFWKKIDAEREEDAPARYLKLLKAAMPAKGIEMTTARRTAGTGSLGRPRWIAVGTWNGGDVVREAKALVPSGWVLGHGDRKGPLGCGELALGKYRAPDPWYAVEGNIVVRRLSPNNRKIEAREPVLQRLSPRLLQAMGRDLAAVHLGLRDASRAIVRDLEKRDEHGWLAASAKAMATVTRRDYADFAGKPR